MLILNVYAIAHVAHGMGRPGQTRDESGRWTGSENPLHDSEENGKTTDQSVEAETPAARLESSSTTVARRQIPTAPHSSSPWYGRSRTARDRFVSSPSQDNSGLHDAVDTQGSNSRNQENSRILPDSILGGNAPEKADENRPTAQEGYGDVLSGEADHPDEIGGAKKAQIGAKEGSSSPLLHSKATLQSAQQQVIEQVLAMNINW